MKSIYTLLIIGVLCLLSNTTNAQVYQYSDDGKNKCIDCQEKSNVVNPNGSEKPNFDCFCFARIGLQLFNLYIPKDNTREIWLRNQERLLKEAIENRLHKNFGSFGEAQRAFFKRFAAEHGAKNILTTAKAKLKTKINNNTNGRKSQSAEMETLRIALDGLINGPVYNFGDLKSGDQYIRNMNKQSLNTRMKDLKSWKTGNQRLAHRLIKTENGLNKLVHRDELENRIIDGFINHYNGFDYENKIRLMTKYLVWQNTGEVLGNDPYTTDIFPPNLYSIGAYDYTSVAESIAENIGDSGSIPTIQEFTGEQAILNHALKGQNSIISWLSSRDQINNKLKKYFKNNSYSQGSITEATNLLNATITEQTFTSNDLNYGHYRSYPADDPIQGLLDDIYQTKYRKNVLRTWHIAPHIVNDSGMAAFFNLVQTLQNSGNLHPNTEGSMIRQAFKVMEITPGWTTYSNEDLAKIFDFSSSSLTTNDVHWATINYAFDIGRVLFDNGIKSTDFIQSNLALEAAKAIATNDMPLAEHYIRIYNLNKALQLNTTQIDWLIRHHDQVLKVNHLMEEQQESAKVKTYIKRIINSALKGSLVTTSPFVKYPKDKAEQYKKGYPEFTKFLKNELPKIANNKKIINEIHGITNAPIDKIKEALQWGKGPEILILQLGGEGKNERYGRYLGHVLPEEINKLRIDIDLVNDIENLKNSTKFREELGFLLAITILHEYVHFGDTNYGFNFWSDAFFEDRLEESEAGILFEKAVFGETVWRSNVGIIMRNFGNW